MYLTLECRWSPNINRIRTWWSTECVRKESWRKFSLYVVNCPFAEKARVRDRRLTTTTTTALDDSPFIVKSLSASVWGRAEEVPTKHKFHAMTETYLLNFICYSIYLLRCKSERPWGGFANGLCTVADSEQEIYDLFALRKTTFIIFRTPQGVSHYLFFTWSHGEFCILKREEERCLQNTGSCQRVDFNLCV